MTDRNTHEREQLRRAAARFTEAFGRPPRFAVAAPGRVNLIGEHTDYNAGFVLPMAIERRTLILADRRADRTGRVVSTAVPEEATFDVNTPLAPGQPAWANYVRGVVAGYLEQGIDPGGFDALIDSNVPTGGGLSSSAALEVATATLIEAMAGRSLEPTARALLCQRAEHEFAGMPCGIMDQFISALAQPGHALLIDCRSHETRPVPMHDPNVAVLVVNTNVAHELVEGAYAERRAQCERAAAALGVEALRDATMSDLERRGGDVGGDLDGQSYHRARHVISENERTMRCAEALATGDWPEAGRLMLASHASLRDDFEVSCPELDLLVELASEHITSGEVFGTRMTGGGFGGCTVTLLRAEAAPSVAEDVTRRYHEKTGIIAGAFTTRPAGGAGTVALASSIDQTDR